MQILLNEDEYKDLKDKSDKYDKINNGARVLRDNLVGELILLKGDNKTDFTLLIKFMNGIIDDINKILE